MKRDENDKNNSHRFLSLEYDVIFIDWLSHAITNLENQSLLQKEHILGICPRHYQHNHVLLIIPSISHLHQG